MFLEDLWRIPLSQELAATVSRASDYTKTLQQVELTLEHLLFSLVEDQDAKEMLRVSNVDTMSLTEEIMNYTSYLERTDVLPHSGQLQVNLNLMRVMEAAASAARQGGRPEINGAILLAAIVGDGKSVAAEFLRKRGLTFDQAIRVIQSALLVTPMSPVSSVTNNVNLSSTHSQAPAISLPQTQGDIFVREQVFSERLGNSSSQLEELPLHQLPGLSQERDPLSLRGSSAPHPDPALSSTAHSAVAPALKVASSNFSPRPPYSGLAHAKSHHGTATLFSRPAAAQNSPPATFPSPSGVNPSLSGNFHGMPQSVPPLGHRISNPALSPNGPYTEQNRKREKEQPREKKSKPQSLPQNVNSGSEKGAVKVPASQLVENIPRRMRVLRPLLVEAKIPRANIQEISEALEEGGAVYRHDVAITKAVSVRLRAPQGGFWIENASPETQWIENILGVVSDDFIRWRWTVTPKSRGKKSLQILMSARTLGTDGVAAETALPDHVIKVKVRPDFSRLVLQYFEWLIAFSLFGLGFYHWGNIQEKLYFMIKLLQTKWPWIGQVVGQVMKALS